MAVCDFFLDLFGGFDTLLVTLLTLLVLDYIAAGIKAIYLKEVSSSLCFKGVAKKLLYLLVVVLSNLLDRLMPSEVPLRDVTILFFIATEGLSVLQNAEGLIPLPDKLKKVLLILREKSDTMDNEENKEKDKEK